MSLRRFVPKRFSVGAMGYRGKELIFVFGPPRSGTTWVFRLLQAHPAVVAANVDNLRVRTGPGVTLESNAFQPRRRLSNEDLKERFGELAAHHPGMRIVEKTPVHVFYADRIRDVFPDCQLVLLERDGRDVVNSMLHVARDPNRWWRAVPKSVEDAANMWGSYVDAGIACAAAHHPHIVRFEELAANTEAVLGDLLRHLGLSTDHIRLQIREAAGGRGIPIPGVFREGAVGTWRRDLPGSDIHTIERTVGDHLRRLGYLE